MDTPPPLEEPFEQETVFERIVGLNEMFPSPLRNAVHKTFSKTTACFKWIFSTSRTLTWIACSSAAILVLPISLETERQEYENQMKRKERDIILGPENM